MDENILPLIHEVASQFQRSGPDVRLIQKAIQDIRDTETVRREIIDDARAQLQKLSREIQLSKSKASRKNINPESLNHDTQMFELDRKKFAIAKTIQDLDQDNASLEAEISKLRMQSLELDSSYKSATTTTNGISDEDGLSRNDHDDDALDDADDVLGDTAHAMAVLRLQLYRGLGIEMLENDLGVYSKARIRSNTQNDVHLVKFDDQLSPYFQTNLIWEFAS